MTTPPLTPEPDPSPVEPIAYDRLIGRLRRLCPTLADTLAALEEDVASAFDPAAAVGPVRDAFAHALLGNARPIAHYGVTLDDDPTVRGQCGGDVLLIYRAATVARGLSFWRGYRENHGEGPGKAPDDAP